MVLPARPSRFIETADQSLHQTGVLSGGLGDKKNPGSNVPTAKKVKEEQWISWLSVRFIISTTNLGCSCGR